MPIPPLSQKTQSPQDWRKPHRKKVLKQKRKTNFRFMKFSKNKKKERTLKSTISLFISLGMLCLLLGGILFLAIFSWVSRDLPDPNKVLDRTLAETTKIYDRTGETILYEIHGEEKRTRVSLEDIPYHAKWATIVTEDKEFYQHPGFNLKGIARAVIKDILRMGVAQGGSSITQQFIKNTILTPEKTFTRKAKELILAYRIEQKFTKDEILEMYLNEIPYGTVAYGIEAASQTYFSKSVGSLSLAESAILAALPKAPTYYSPYGSHRDELFARQHYILEAMYQEGYISETERDEALKAEIEFKPKIENILAPHFIFYVKELLTEKYGQAMVEQGGLKIYTTLDLYKQKIAEEVVEAGAEKNLNYNASNAALVALDPKTGQLLAMVGSRDYFNTEIDGNVNVALRPRQPGSSFKPIVYAAAFEKGYTPEAILYDVETDFVTAYTGTGKPYHPQNYNNQTYGPVSMKKALAGSLNIPAVKTIYLVGIDKVLDLAEDMGYTTFSDRSRFGLSLVLGGGEIKLLEHVYAFSSLAREGLQVPLTSILKVEDKDGRIIEEWHKTSPQRMLGSQTARQINNILSDNEARNFVFGSSNFLNLGTRPVAAKTGTTNDFRDAWTLGYTPSLAAGVWVGNNDNTPMKKGSSGARVAAPIWHKFMRRLLEGTPVEYFQAPEKPDESLKPILKGEGLGEVKVLIDKASGKLATDLTPQSFTEEKIFQQVHSILHFVDKNNPRGPVPEDPSLDPEYASWEKAVSAWSEAQGFINEEVPTEYDDLHRPENQPTLELISPANNETLYSRLLEVQINTQAPRGVARVEYYLDGKLIKTLRQTPFDLTYQIPNKINKGFHTLTVISYDDIDNSHTEAIDFNFLAEKEPLRIFWEAPQDGSTLSVSNFPYTLSVFVSDLENIQKVDFYFSPSSFYAPKLIGSIIKPEENTFVLDWKTPPPASAYQLWLQITPDDEETFQSEKILIELK